jgi:hypothetical protein
MDGKLKAYDLFEMTHLELELALHFFLLPTLTPAYGSNIVYRQILQT